jgi:hypothetical protein
VTIVSLAIDLVVQANATMRGAASCLELVAKRLQLGIVTPSCSALRSWLLRVGCYALTCWLECGQRVWLLDHTVQIGAAKLFVVVSCLLSDAPFGERALQLTDLQLVHIALMEHSTAETVKLELEKAALRTGIPREIVSDQGSDIIAGVNSFIAKANIAYVHDMAHQAANVLKQRWSKEVRWETFVAKLSSTAAKLRQTNEAFVRPPTIRAKARFMNTKPTLTFATRMLKLLDGSATARIEQHYGWLREYRADVLNWTSEQAAAEFAVRHVGVHGVNQQTAATLELAYENMTLTNGAEEVAKQMRKLVRVAGNQASNNETLVGSTEVLESLFGKLKQLEGSYANDGFTTLTLALGALLGNRTEEQVAAALAAVPEKVAVCWLERLIGITVHQLKMLFVKSTTA